MCDFPHILVVSFDHQIRNATCRVELFDFTFLDCFAFLIGMVRKPKNNVSKICRLLITYLVHNQDNPIIRSRISLVYMIHKT